MLPDRSLSIEQKLVENAKYQNGQNLANLNIFGIFNELLSIQNVNVARFARNVECDFFLRFSNTVISWDFSWPFSKVTLTIFTSVLVFLLLFFFSLL